MGRVSLILIVLIWGLPGSGQSFAQRQSTDASSATSVGTTEGIGGLTTEGFNAGNTGSTTGSNASATAEQRFAGAANAEDFVGSAREPTANSQINRFFREIVGGEVPTGGTQESSSSPRRVPVTLRLGFNAPAPREAAVLAGSIGSSLERYLTARPDLRSITVAVDDDGMATLAGEVAEPSSKRLATNLIRLLPGVNHVRNRIDVAGPGAVLN